MYDGVEPVAATSARFAVRVRQEVGRVRSPHVYVTLSPDAQLEQVHPTTVIGTPANATQTAPRPWVSCLNRELPDGADRCS